MFAESYHAGRIDFQSNPHISPVCLPDVFQVLDTKPNKAEIQSLVHSGKWFHDSKDFSGERCWVSGWGKDALGEEGTYQPVLKEVSSPL